MENQLSNEDVEKNFDLKMEINKYTIHWKWFVLCLLITFFAVYLKLRYTKPLYKAATTILIKDNSKSGGLSELAAFSDLAGGSSSKNIDNEIQILKSRTLIESTVKKLGLNVNLVAKGNVIDSELYLGAPIQVQFLNPSVGFYEKAMAFNYQELAGGKFMLSGDFGLVNKNQKAFFYDKPIATEFGDLMISKNERRNNNVLSDLTIVVTPLENVVENYKNILEVAPLSGGNAIVALSFTDAIPQRAESFLNALVQNYNDNGILDKSYISQNTSKFIANRLALINNELDGVEQNVESFKRNNKLIDLVTESGLYVNGADEFSKKVVEAETQLSIMSSMADFLSKSKPSDLLPTNIFSGTTAASSAIDEYNKLVLDRNRILKSATETNPTVVKLNQQLTSLKSTINTSLNREKNTLTIQKKNLEESEGLFNKKIGKAPTQERQFRILDRQQKVKEGLYLYLLQKREETAILLSSTEPTVKVIDAALASKSPVSPNRKAYYLGALLIGLLIPFGIIFLLDFLDTKIKSRFDIETKTKIPFIGDVPSSESANEIIATESRTSSAEALRIIRTNLEFMLTKVPEGRAKTIFLTSTFPKEGKTFVSVNLAATFALSGKRVLLIGMDIRNPKLDEYLTVPDRGVTNYLSSNDLNIEDLIVKYPGYEDFYILPAGVIPPNPAELLMGKKVDTLFNELKDKYDYIIVDTAPVSLVTDTLLIAKHADCFIYVARANYLEKRMLSIPSALYKDGKLPNMCMLLNDTDSTKGYGYGYGYGVEVIVEPWYKKLWKK
ncbi:capsular exopolysaccharide synthesis family protein [Flavobacterium sp. 28A]|uniref:GumC family protein n=1 Tax=Flavobacterium sp. 28A TaxID=2735895 RepID=UPI001571436D|nr:tyrosine-protein kinase [Flavobacterium sp. 28A]NRT15119.1 capsular exopolysaccharide synthesis family protein [Flavobacterium sp. 28A]